MLPFEFVSLESTPTSPPGMAVIGDAVTPIAYVDGQPQEDIDLKTTPDAASSVITVQYSEADLRGAAEEICASTPGPAPGGPSRPAPGMRCC